MRVLVVGAGGHAQVVADILLCMKSPWVGVEPVGFVGESLQASSTSYRGLPVIGDLTARANFDYQALIVGIGDNRARLQILQELTLQNERIVQAIHPSSTIAADVHIDDGVAICAGAIINTGARISLGAIINTSATIDHHCALGAGCHLAPGSNLAGNVSVGEGALVGIGACVTPGVSIGAWAIVGAGAAVTRDVAPNSTVVGVPARPIRHA